MNSTENDKLNDRLLAWLFADMEDVIDMPDVDDDTAWEAHE